MIWRSSYHRRVAEAFDFFTALVSMVFSYILAFKLNIWYPKIFPMIFELHSAQLVIWFLMGGIYVFLFNKNGAYNYQRFKSFKREVIIVLKVCSLSTLAGIFIIYMYGFKQYPRSLILNNFLISCIFFTLNKSVLILIAALIRSKGIDRKKILLVGSGERTISFIKTVKDNFNWGLDIVGILSSNESPLEVSINDIKVLGSYKDLEKTLKIVNPEEVLITISTKRFDQIREILEICEIEGVTVRLNSDFFGKITKQVNVQEIFGLNIISFNMVRQLEISLFIKRLIDIIGSLIAIIIFSPLMIFAALSIWLFDGRPILYNWNVVGLNKQPFRSWKFRTMVKNADELKEMLTKENEMDGPVFKIKNDPRIIPIGRFLRKFSIDETPQLFSVLKGDMSLVGPRPAGPHELNRYESWHRRKLSVKPGLTCLWQASGRNQIKKFDDWVKMDLEYIDNWSIMLDIKILLKTIPAVLFGRGAS